MRTRVNTPNGRQLYAESYGPVRGRATVIFSHDWLADQSTWSAVDEALADSDLHRVRYDLRGHGRSAPAPIEPGRNGITQLGHDLAAVVASTAPVGPIVLVGHGLGAQAVMAFAALHPEVVQQRVVGVLFAASTAGAIKPPRRLLKLVKNVPGGKELVLAMRAHDARPSLPALRRTRVAVVAPELDEVVPFADQRALVGLIDGARLLSVPAAGHDVLREAPQVVAAEVLALLRKVPGPSRLPGQRRLLAARRES